MKKLLYIIPVLFIMCTSPNEPGNPGWVPMNDGLPAQTTVQCISVASSSPQVVYIGTFSGVYKKQGSAWQAKNTGLANLDIYTIAVDPNNADRVFAGTWGTGVFRSTDGGESWSSTWPQDFSPHINSIAVKNSAVVFAATENGLMRSTDGGNTWTLLRFGGIKTVAISPHESNTIFIGVKQSGNFRSTDNGDTWEKINTGVYTDNVSYAAANCFQFNSNPDQVFMSTEWVDLYQSDNRGDTWQQLGQEIKYKSVQTLQIESSAQNRFWAVTKDDGIYRSTDTGETWKPFNDDLQDVTIKSLKVVPGSTTIYAGTLGKGIFKYVEQN